MEDGAARGVPWAVLTYAISRLATVLTTVVLARVLLPGDFGLMAVALLVIGAAQVIGELGLGGVLVLWQDLDRRAMGTLFSLMALLGTAAMLVLAAVAPVMAVVFDEGRLTWILVAMAPGLAVSALTWFYESLLQRELLFARRFACYVAYGVTFAVVALSLGFLGAGVWCLVVGQLAAVTAQGIAFVAVAPYRVRPAFDRAVARRAVGQGSAFMAQGGIAFLRQNADYLAVGSLLGSARLGIYSMGYRLSELPSWGVADPVAKVTFPSFARMRARGEDVGGPFRSTLGLVALVTCPVGIALSAAAGPFTTAVLGDRWASLATPLVVLGLWGAVRPVQVTLGWFLNSIGRAGSSARTSAVVSLVLVPSAFLAAAFGGITAVAGVMLAEAIVTSVLFVFLAQRHGAVAAGGQLRALQPVIIAGGLAWVAGRLAVHASEGAVPAAVSLVLSVVAVLLTFTATIAALRPGMFGDLIRLGVRAVGLADRPSRADT